MHDTTIPTPGVVLGCYPQRQHAESGFLERAIHAVSGMAHRRWSGRESRFERVIRLVEEHGAGLADLSESDLGSEVKRLRIELSRQGFTDPLVARSFALIREMARRTLGLRHFDVQLIGGWLMMQGMVAEMETGEGKTLTATLPACTAALAGVPVHVVTVNDYLVTRDAGWMEPLYRALGLTVGTVTEGMEPKARMEAYRCDITYCSNKQLVFDYLKDRLVLGETHSPLGFRLERLHGRQSRLGDLLLRGLCFAIVDEADSVLVDEARTPLIISRENKTLDVQRLYQEALALAECLEAGADFVVDEPSRTVRLTEPGRSRVTDLAASLGGLWRGVRRAQELVGQALTAKYLFVRDKHYIVRDDKVQIVDEFTGRIMADRSWERGLHQLIETKEGCPVTSPKETLARISYQQFFRRYLKLAGMTGTAREVAGELWAVYRLNTVKVPTNRPVRRVSLPTRIHRTAGEKWDAVVQRIAAVHGQGRPVLIGTRSVAASEHLSVLLSRAGLPHHVLNARQDSQEAEIVQDAGGRGQITVATNMAGRGTDIKLGLEAAELGGLHVIATEMHEARRIDRQLFGRCGRQGDPGSFEMAVSLEDDLVRVYGSPLARVLLTRLVRSEPSPFVDTLLMKVARMAQRAAERGHSRIRCNTLRMDEQIRNMLAFSGSLE
jgi:preprotein translocase subunit SecA